MKEKEWCEYSHMPSPYYYMDENDWDTICTPEENPNTIED